MRLKILHYSCTWYYNQMREIFKWLYYTWFWRRCGHWVFNYLFMVLWVLIEEVHISNSFIGNVSLRLIFRFQTICISYLTAWQKLRVLRTLITVNCGHCLLSVWQTRWCQFPPSCDCFLIVSYLCLKVNKVHVSVNWN